MLGIALCVGYVIAMREQDIPDAAERRKSTTKKARGGRTDGSPVAPTGVPKADHVADPENAPPTNGATRARPTNT